ncbi:MAG TPA: iron-containing redox enzyme family protein [Rhodanobacteraceae bacterium]|nr:iron-containing redox enzyme family protein [Rhodanobacteraceae bacterium]
MNPRFELSGPLTEISSYPQWTQDMVADCDRVKRAVVQHELWDLMRDNTLGDESTANFMIGIWPVIERFPGYMAQSLLKTRFGRSEGDNLARRWLVRNIRVEQNHAEYWLDWAEGAGVARERVLHESAPHGTQALANWCEEISSRGSLAAGIAATNYAVEGATGEWSQIVYDSLEYQEIFPAKTRKATLRWLQLHAAYDDTHPWEALEIVCTLLGASPRAEEVAHISECIKRSYRSMCISMESCYRGLRLREAGAGYEAAVAA